MPNASVSPNPVLKSTTLTAKNLMQKAAAATLNSVAWQITPGGGSGTLGASFLPVNGTAGVTAPATTGNYTLTLTYNYTDHNGAPQSAQVQKPFQVTDFVPVPVLGVYKGANKHAAGDSVRRRVQPDDEHGVLPLGRRDDPGRRHAPGRQVLPEQRLEPVDRPVGHADRSGRRGARAGRTTTPARRSAAPTATSRSKCRAASRLSRSRSMRRGGGGCPPDCGRNPGA